MGFRGTGLMPEHWLHKVDEAGETPLARAAKSGHMPTITLMFSLTDTKEPAHLDESPMHAAARLSDVAQVRMLLDDGADINEMDEYGLTALHWAAINGCMDLARLLVNRGADLNVRSPQISWLTPTALAKWMNYDELVRFLETNGGLC